MKISTETFEGALDVVATLYRSAIEPQPSSSPLDRLGPLLQSHGAQLYRYERRTGAILEAMAHGTETDEANNRLYAEHWGQYDPRPALSARQASGTVLRCHDHFSDAFVSRSAFYQDFFIPSGYRWALGGVLHEADGTSTVIAAIRTVDQDRYETWARDVLTGLLPHFARAGALGRMLRAPRQARACASLDALLSLIPTPCLVLDPTTGVVHAINPAVGAWLSSPQSGLRWTGGRLKFLEAPAEQEWHKAMQQMPQPLVDAPLVMCIDGGLWRVEYVPCSHFGLAHDAFDQRLVLVSFHVCEQGTVPQLAGFSRRHGLTPAETRVLELLSHGLGPKEIARRRDSSPHTVRSQLMSILQKTGTHSQRELLARVNGLQQPGARTWGT